MTSPIPEGFGTLTPHITVKGAAAAIEFYGKAFGAEEIKRHAFGDTVAHAQIKIGDSFLMLNDEFPQHGALGPPEQGSGVVLHLYVADIDRAYERAVQAGAESVMPPENQFWGDRYAMVKDPFGHRWSIATHVEDLTEEEVAERAPKAFGGA